MTEPIEIASAPELAHRFVARLSQEAARAIDARGRCVIALSGGSVAARFVPAWIDAEVDWSRCELLWVDERAVSPDDPDSNFGLAWRSGLDRLTWTGSAVHRLRADSGDLEHAAEMAEAELLEVLGEAARVDVALVGLGPDGHVASLFPGHPALAANARWVVAVYDAPKSPSRRLTWTFRAFAAVDWLAVAAFGVTKAAAVAELRDPGRRRSPAARALQAAKRGALFVDAAAAGDPATRD
jgi:6-phosphogluconolactonase